MDNLLFFAACLLTAVGVIFLLVFFIMNSVTNYRILIKMLNHERVDLDIDERKYERIKYLTPFDGVDRYLIKIGARRLNDAEKFLKKIGTWSLWIGLMLWSFNCYSVSEWWGYPLVAFIAFVIMFSILTILTFVTSIFVNSSAKKAYKKYKNNSRK